MLWTKYLSIIIILVISTTVTTNVFAQNETGITSACCLLHGQNYTNIVQSPLKQFKSGIKTEDVRCADGFTLVIKAEDESPACIYPSTIPKLIVRGWLSTISLDQNNILSGDFYSGIENDSGFASIKNQTYYIMTLSDLIDPTTIMRFHDVIFSFPYGSLVTPGGGLLPVAMTFPDGLTESFGYAKRNPDGSGIFSGLGLGPGPSFNRTITILSNHVGPKAGVTLTEDKIKFLVSTDADTKNSNPLGVIALVIYHPSLGCLGSLDNTTENGCPPNNFYLKINSNSIAYLLSYNICDASSCTKNDTLSVLLLTNIVSKPNYQMIGLPVNLQWKDGDMVNIQLKVSTTNDNQTGYFLNIENSTIVP